MPQARIISPYVKHIYTGVYIHKRIYTPVYATSVLKIFSVQKKKTNFLYLKILKQSFSKPTLSVLYNSVYYSYILAVKK